MHKKQAWVNVFFKSLNVEKTTEFKQYTPLQFLNALGGAMSLWLGISLVAIFEYFEFLLRLAKAIIVGKAW